MTHSSHIKYMIIAGAVALAGLWAFGVPLGRALPYAILLACPLMMVFMMRGMDHGGHGGASHAPSETDTAGHQHHDRSTTNPVDAPTPTLAGDQITGIDKEYRR